MDYKAITDQVKQIVKTDESQALSLLSLLNNGDSEKANIQLAEIKAEIELDAKKAQALELSKSYLDTLNSTIEFLPDPSTLNEYSRVSLNITLMRKTTKDKETQVETTVESWTPSVVINPKGDKMKPDKKESNGNGSSDAPNGISWNQFVKESAPNTFAKYEGKSVNMREVAKRLQKVGYYNDNFEVVGDNEPE